MVFETNGIYGRSLASCGDNHDGTSVMEKVSDIVLQFPALRSFEGISKNMSSGLAGKQTLTITVNIFARGKNTDELTFHQFIKTQLEEKCAGSLSCFTLQSIVVVNRDDPASLPSLKSKKSKSNKKQTPPLHNK